MEGNVPRMGEKRKDTHFCATAWGKTFTWKTMSQVEGMAVTLLGWEVVTSIFLAEGMGKWKKRVNLRVP